MPVRHDMHRSCGAACRADHAQADARPRLILREGIEPHVHSAIAAPVQALDAAGHMPDSQPFHGAAGRIMAGPFCVSTTSAHAVIKATSQVASKLSISGRPKHARTTAPRGGSLGMLSLNSAGRYSSSVLADLHPLAVGRFLLPKSSAWIPTKVLAHRVGTPAGPLFLGEVSGSGGYSPSGPTDPSWATQAFPDAQQIAASNRPERMFMGTPSANSRAANYAAGHAIPCPGGVISVQPRDGISKNPGCT